MTFLEAAIEVLRREGKPLPVRRLAELAVQHNLLSVVGRDPEATMQARLDEVLDKGPTHAELARAGAGMYGLRVYPPRPYPVPRENPEPEVAEGDEGADDAAGDDAAPKAEEGAPAPGRRRRRRGRGRGGENAPATTPIVAAEAVATEPANDQAPAVVDADADDDAGEFEVDAESSAPLIVATTGDEDATRSGEEREVRSEILGRRDERGRHRHGQQRGGRPQGDRPQGDRPQGDRPQHAQPKPQQHQPRPQAAPYVPPAATGAAPRSLATDLSEMLRAQDGRPQHTRALAQEVERAKILEGRPQPEISREVRMALYGELSSRPSRGLRARVRSLGGGNYASVERKLDDEVLQAERAVEAALDRLAVVTTTAVRRKLSRLSPFSFEQLGRLIAESIGVERPTLVRRGEGVAYFGGERSIGAARSRVLIAIRTGEGELGRRAIGELRAGLDARGFDEGVLLALGRLSNDAREELRAGRAVTVYDGDSIATLLVDKRLGVRVQHAPVAYIDVDFFAELNET